MRGESEIAEGMGWNHRRKWDDRLKMYDFNYTIEVGGKVEIGVG